MKLLTTVFFMMALTACGQAKTFEPKTEGNKLLLDCFDNGQKVLRLVVDKFKYEDNHYTYEADNGNNGIPFKCAWTEVTTKQIEDMAAAEKKAYEDAVKAKKEAEEKAKTDKPKKK